MPAPLVVNGRSAAGAARAFSRHLALERTSPTDRSSPTHVTTPYLEAAFARLHGALAVVLDLRRDGGGDPGTVMLVPAELAARGAS